MDVRMLFGRHAGQVVDVEVETALAMLNDGRAENPYRDAPKPEPPAPAAKSARKAAR